MLRFVLIFVAIFLSQANAAEILFIGNSMTLHGKSPALEWNGEWGMAASSGNLDYVHLVKRTLGEKLKKPVQSRVVNASWLERGETGWQGRVDGLKNGAALDYLVIFLGDNVSAMDDEEFINRLSILYKTLSKRHVGRTVIVGTWWAKPVNERLSTFSQQNNIPFVSLSDLWMRHELYANAERKVTNSGVGIHPGDKAMDIIHSRIVEKLIN